MSHIIKTNRMTAAAAAALLLLSAAGLARPAGEFLKGKVIRMEAPASLKQGFDRALDDFRKTGTGELFFTGYIFPCRYDVHWRESKGHPSDFRVSVIRDRIRMKSPGEHEGESNRIEKGGGPAGLLVLRKTGRGGSEVLDVHLLDPDNTYDFADIPVYWLGESGADASMDFLRLIFEKEAGRVRKSLVFVISGHDTGRAFDFLGEAALGSYETDVRKDAVFWIGNSGDPRTLKILRDIYARDESDEIRKQVVFALYLTKSEESVEELIRIGRREESREVRKQAVFWLGQIAGQAAVEALKGFAEEGEDTEIKKQAVFAISQQPAGTSVPILIDIARTNRNPAVRKQAIFWLSQKDSDAALKFFEEILLKKKEERRGL